MIYLLIFVLGVWLGATLAWRWGWNKAINYYRDRVVEGAKSQAERDRM